MGNAFNYLDEDLKSYLERVSAKTPAPGGGSAVACVAAVCSALINMVLNYTIGKEKYAAYAGELEKMKAENDDILKRLSLYIEEDSVVYDNIRKHSAEKNTAAAEEYMKKSVLIHLDICKISLKIVDFTEFLAEKGNKNLISDTGIAADLAVSSFNIAKLNVMINLKFMGDGAFVQKSKYDMAAIENEIGNRGKAVYNKILKGLEGKDGR